ncbi:membrane protein [Bombiscardovia apis]|uniref:Membrane protein n=1 Tax=Bombiscardovia apis TaxID=2932182 RepID=A0ABM8BEH9_9BIFI|nr:DUF2207 domain-containing protein [Bombiscardovia apis]BDR55213.1 membrane protein [Bombiscardovia apis]
MSNPNEQGIYTAQPNPPLQQSNPYTTGASPLPTNAQLGGRKGGFWSAKRFFSSLAIAIIITAVLGFLFAVVTTAARTPELSYNSLKYDTTVLPNGDLRVKQRVDMRLLSREDDDGDKPWRQLYQQYEIKPLNLTGISDVSVRNVSDDRTYSRTEAISPSSVADVPDWDDSQANRWYMSVADRYSEDGHPDYQYTPLASGTPSSSEFASCEAGRESCTVEIGWNIPQIDKADSLVFEIEMTMHGVSTAYDDVTSFQWEPVGTNNETQIESVTGTIHLPKGANASNCKAWLHFTGESTSSRGADGSLRFEAKRVAPGQYIDTAVTMDHSLTQGVERTMRGEQGKNIADREDKEERSWRQMQQTKARTVLIVWAILGIVVLAAVIYCLATAFSTRRQSQYHGEVIYRRDAPQMSPASAAALGTVVYGGKRQLRSRQMASSVLSLANKGAIAIYPGPAQRYAGLNLLQTDAHSLGEAMRSASGKQDKADKTSTVVIYPVASQNPDSLGLTGSERAVLDLLLKAGERLQTAVFDMNQMRDSFKDYEKASTLLENFENAVAAEFGLLAATRSRENSVILEVLAVIGAVFVWLLGKVTGQTFLGACTGSVLMISAIFALCYGASEVLTEQGQDWAGQVVGFRSYITDFSSFADRGVNDLVMWGTYLVYAAALGISKEAMQQLAKAYPQVTDEAWLDAHPDHQLIYMSYRSYGVNGGWNSSSGSMGSESFNQAFVPDFSDLGGQLSSSFSQLQSTISDASGGSGSSGGSFSGGGFGGSSGGSGGGSFGGR